MRKLALQMQYTLDGFVGGPDGDLEWVFPNFNDAVAAWIVDHISKAGVHIMGSHTFRDMIEHWPTSVEPYAPPMNNIPKVVFSKKGLDVRKMFSDYHGKAGQGGSPALVSGAESWADATVASGDLSEEIKRLKSQTGGEILAHGGAGFVQALIGTGLVDEYRLLIHPIVLGDGLPIFKDLPEPFKLTLVSAETFPTGLAAHIYRPA